jgi:SNF2 family DNA or RNA helicase
MSELHDYQLVARDFLRGDGRGLFLDMGMGKTATVLSALEPRHLPALVIAPKRVCENVWPEERDKWRPDLSMAVAFEPRSQQCGGLTGTGKRCRSRVIGASECSRHGGPAAVTAEQHRRRALESRADITVISRDNISDLLVVNRVWSTVILDELSGFKSSTSTRFKVARKIPAKRVWGLTGTPSPNGYLDLWSQIYLLDNGKRLGKSVSGYRERYFTPSDTIMSSHGPVVVGWKLRPGAEDRIKSLLENLVISMEGDQEEAIVNKVVVPIPFSVREKYVEFAKELVVQMDLLGEVSAANRAVLTNKLTQLTTGFLFADDGSGEYEWLHDAKLDALDEIINGTGSPVLVFYHYQPELARLCKRFPQAETLDAPDAVKRWNAGKIPVLLAHPASAGHGLNLQYGGHTVVWTTLTWSLELWEQGNGRLNRQGQEHPVMVHVLCVRGTVDELQAKSLTAKAVVQDSLLDYLRSPI